MGEHRLIQILSIIHVTHAAFYTNVTFPACMYWEDTNSPTFEIVKDRILVGKYLSSNTFLVPNATVFYGRIQNATFDQQNKNFSFCIVNTTISDGGSYNLTSGNNYWTRKLYVLGKPQKASISVVYDGIVNKSQGIIACISLSTSTPGVKMSFYWQNNGEKIEADRKYSFNGTSNEQLIINVELIDRFKNYSCYAREENGQTSDRSDMITIDPKSVASVTLQPTVGEYRVIENDRFELTCNAEGAYPAKISYSWFKDNIPINGQNTNIFTIANTSKTDHAVYNCTVSNHIGINGSANMSLNVLYGPDILMMAEIAKEENSNISVNCNVSSNPKAKDNEIVWTKQDNNSFSHTGPHLFIPNVNRADHGTFVCTVKITLHPTGNYSVGKSDSKTVQINVLYGPNILPISVVPLLEGKDLNVTCEVQSNPKATDNDVVWTKVSNSTFRQNGMQLFMPNLNRINNGTYLCNATVKLEPSYGQPVWRSASQTTPIIVLYSPSVRMNELHVRVNETERVAISCNVDSYPTSSITWTYVPSNTSITETNNTLVTENKMTSIIDIIGASCDDTGTYRCTASNNIKVPASNTTELSVLCKPRLGKYFEKNYTYAKNETISLIVWFTAFPEPSFNWTFNETFLSPQTKKINITTVKSSLPYMFGTQLSKNEIFESDTGIYKINAENDIGNMTIEFNIIVSQEPSRPINVSSSCRESPGTAIIHWVRGWNGGLDKIFAVKYRLITENTFRNASENIKEQPVKDSYSYTISNLLHSQTYVFKVVAANDVGISESEQVTCKVRGSKSESSASAVAIGGIGGAIAALVIIVVIILLKRRQEKTTKCKRATLPFASDDKEFRDGLRDNILYESAGHDFKLNDNTEATVYAVVQKSTKKKSEYEDKQQESSLYAGVQKQTLLTDTATTKLSVKGKNIGHTTKTCENISGIKNDVVDDKNKTNKGGLVYVELVFNNNPKDRKFIIHGTDNKTNYADIDLNLKADPELNEDSGNEDKNKKG